MKFFVACVLSLGCGLAPILAQAPTEVIRTSMNGGSDTSGKIMVPPEKLRPVVIPKSTAGITIDGKPEEEIWKQAAVFKDFYQTSPGNNTQPSKPTEVLVMYDEKHLYVAFKCWDDKSGIRATVAKRDNVTGEDNVRMWLDTYNDQRRAYVIAFNPYGIQQDGMFTEGQGADFSVDIVMESKGVIEDWGWSVEAKIPFKSLRYAAGKGKFWGFNVARNIDRFNDEFNQWLPDDRNVSGFLIKHGKITGLDEIKYERTLEIVPSITLSQTGKRVSALEVPDGRFINTPVRHDLGVTLKYSFSPNVTFDAAINPDFAEIDADAPVVTANQRFPIFFQEKRPFFLESAEIFQTPLAIYHSRNIVDPDLALKLTGKINKDSFGLMVASDKAPGNYDEEARYRNLQCLERRRLDPRLECSIDEFLDKNALFGVFRVKRDFGAENNIGLFGTYRSFPEQKNVLASIDGRLKFRPTLSSVFQVTGTHSRRCVQDKDFEPLLNFAQAASNRAICGTGSYDTSLAITDPRLLNVSSTYNRYRTGNGLGYYANMDYTTDRHGWFAEVGGRTKDFRADVGFTRRTDTNFAFFYNRFSTKSDPKAKLIRANFGQFTGVDYDWKGRIQSWRGGGNVNYSLQRSIFGFVEGWAGYEKLYEEEFGLRRRPTRLGQFFGDATRSTWKQGFYTEMGQNLNKYVFYNAWVSYTNNAFDYFFFREQSPGVFKQDPGPGKSISAGASLDLKPINPLRFSINYQKSRLVRNDNRARTFDSDIVSIRSTYQFSRFLFTRMRLDYNSLGQNYSGQVLFGFNPSPGKAFYVGYNDNVNRDSRNPFTGAFEPGFNRNERSFFIRASYLFRKSF
jgi:hypothetical protein